MAKEVFLSMSSKHSDSSITFPVLIPTLQIGFYSRLTEYQAEFLMPALLDLVATLDIAELDRQLLTFAGKEKLAFLARFGLRGELLFPVPYVLTQKPNLLGYYRLLLGFSQKEFYSKSPFGLFFRMETRNTVNAKTVELLPKLSLTLIESAWMLAEGIPSLSKEILDALTLLTLGGQLRGSYNTFLGQQASKDVFDLIKAIVSSSIEKEENTSLNIRNAAGRIVRIEFAPDPDIAIREQLGSGKLINRIAIEIKGGKDVSNIHNRLGEAEKSHQKAKNQGFTQFWTVINVDRLDYNLARRESPTTNYFFPLAKITHRNTQEYRDFRELLLSELGLKQDDSAGA